MKTKTITVNTSNPYDIYIGRDMISSTNNNVLIKECLKLLNKNYNKAIFIVDANLGKYYKETFERLLLGLKNIEIIYLNISEKLKTRSTKEKLEDKLLDLNCGRDTFIVAIGGGVLLDLVGFVAATYKRGVPVIYVPTTLLAMVDASVGGKTGLNTKHGKNLIGIIKQPKTVIIDTRFLQTLSKDDYLSAFAEIIKVAVLYSKDLFDYILDNINLIITKNADFNKDFNLYINSNNNNLKDVLIKLIYESVIIKKSIVEQDEHESGLRELLNFGHTIGHAIEKSQNYLITHGYAVAIGVWIESEISHQLEVLSEKDLLAIKKVLMLLYSDKIRLNCIIDSNNFSKYLNSDKKSKFNQPHYVLIKSIGKYYKEQICNEGSDKIGYKYSHMIDKMISDSFTEMVLRCEIVKINSA